MIKHHIKLAFIVISVLNAISATAAIDFSLLGADVSVSGFGTAGYAISDKPYNYERVISDDGTIARDSLFGLQADVKLTNTIGATVQGKFAPLQTKDSTWSGILNWAFLSWRPFNDLLFRVGKQRVPLYLYSETLDIGVTYDFSHLPNEMYYTSPSNDYVGGSFSKNWNFDLGELTLNGYAGRSTASWRQYQRDNIRIPGSILQFGANYLPLTMDLIGTTLILQREDEYKIQATFQSTVINMKDGKRFVTAESLMPASYFVPATLAPALNGSAYTPTRYSDKLTSLGFVFGTEINLPENFKFIAEYSRRKIDEVGESGIDTNGGYFAILKEFDGWTPYVSFAMLKSNSEALKRYQSRNSSSGLSVKAGMPPAVQAVANGAVKLVNASQRVMADGLTNFDQHTLAIGAAYRFTPTQKIKFEWARTDIGVKSHFVDAPSGGDVSNQAVDIFSFSYNFAF
jgi:hypothetical protein